MGVPATQLRVGQVINYEDDLWVCVKLEQKKLSKGGGAVQAKLKNLQRGDHITHRFRSADKVETAYLDKKDCEYLYPDGEFFVFMDTKDFEQYQLHADFVGDLMPFVKHNEKVVVTFHEGKSISVDLPPSVILQITETDPGFKGDSVNNVFKPATLETGLQVKIPNHVAEGDLVKISTETGDFIERVKQP